MSDPKTLKPRAVGFDPTGGATKGLNLWTYRRILAKAHFADDSGLCVEALQGRPGIFSARWAEDEDGNRDWMRAMEKVWRECEAIEPDAPPAAHFACSLAIAWPNDGQAETFDGRVDGILVWPPRGDKGFGYDPMFVPVGHEQTFGEMEPLAKHKMSHRAEAFRKFVAALNE